MNSQSLPFRMISASLQIILVGTFVFYSVFAQFAIPRTVLCVGERGHLAIEAIAQTEHGEPIHSTHELATSNQISFDSVHQNPCTDIPVWHRVFSHFAPAKQNTPPSASRQSPRFLTGVVLYAHSGRYASFFHFTFFDRPETHLRSTVLLI